MTLPEFIALSAPMLAVALALAKEHLDTKARFHDVAEHFRHLEHDLIDVRMRCPDKDFLKHMDARLISLEAKLDHMSRLLATLVEIKNGSEKA